MSLLLKKPGLSHSSVTGLNSRASPANDERPIPVDKSSSTPNIYPSPPDVFPSPDTRGLNRPRTPTLISVSTSDASNTMSIDRTTTPHISTPSISGARLIQPVIKTPQSSVSFSTPCPTESAINETSQNTYPYSRQHASSQSLYLSTLAGPNQFTNSMSNSSRHVSATPSHNPTPVSTGTNLTYDAFWSSLSNASHPTSTSTQAHRLAGNRSTYASTTSNSQA